MKSELQLKEYVISNFIFITKPEIVLRMVDTIKLKEESNLEVDVEILSVENQKTPDFEKKNPFAILLRLHINKNDSDFDKNLFRISTELIGFFEYHEELNKDIQTKIFINAATMLYGTARGIIGQITANSPFGKYTIPGIYMYKIFEEKLKHLKNKEKKE